MSASSSQGIRSGPALNSKFRVKSAETCTTAHHTTTFTDPRAMQAAPDASADPDVRRQYLRYQLDTLRGQEVLDGLTFSDGRASGGVTPLTLLSLRFLTQQNRGEGRALTLACTSESLSM